MACAHRPQILRLTEAGNAHCHVKAFNRQLMTVFVTTAGDRYAQPSTIVSRGEVTICFSEASLPGAESCLSRPSADV